MQSSPTGSIKEAVRIRRDKATFGPSLIDLIFSVKVKRYICYTNIAFILNNSLFFHSVRDGFQSDLEID